MRAPDGAAPRQHRNVLYFDGRGKAGSGGDEGRRGGRVWRLGDLDAAARTGEEVTELMGWAPPAAPAAPAAIGTLCCWRPAAAPHHSTAARRRRRQIPLAGVGAEHSDWRVPPPRARVRRGPWRVLFLLRGAHRNGSSPRCSVAQRQGRHAFRLSAH